MVTRRQTSASPVAEIAIALLAQPEAVPRARVIADKVAALLPGAAAVVYVILDQDNPAWTAKATAGEVTVGKVIDFNAGTLGAVAQSRTLRVFEGASLRREDFSHLDIRRTGVALAYAPLLVDETLVGAIELVCYEQSVSDTALQSLNEIAELAAPAIATALSYEDERNVSLQSISRVAQMYDLEKVFNSTLQMDELLEMIAKKFAEVLKVQGINLWMVSGEAVELVSQAGLDPTVSPGTMQKGGDGIAGNISDSGESVLLDDPEDERLQQRNSGCEEGAVFSLLAAPLMEHESLVGVVEAVNRRDGLPFDEDDQFLLANICETASNALHNASLLEAERKVEILHTLVSVSQEIASTLNQERVLDAIVNQPQRVIPYDRGAIALDQRGSVRIKAISGVVQINPSDPEVQQLETMLRWVSGLGQEVHVSQRDGEVQDTRPETREKFKRYFEQTEFRGFFAVPLADEEGRLGILSFESSNPDFLSAAHLEIIQVLASQATVALRNASLYKEVPFIDLLEPVLTRKRKFLAMEKSRRLLYIGAAAAVFVFLAGFPLQLRVDGPAIVAPTQTAKVQPEVAGLVQSIKVREGDSVRQGDILAKLEDWQYRAALAGAEAKYQIALSAMDRALASNDGTEAGVQRVEVEFWKAEVGRNRERLERTSLRSPIDGRVSTPHIEDLVGRSLNPGDTFAEIVNTSKAIVDVAVDEADIGRLQSGEKAAIKLEGIPNRTFRAPVAQVSPQAELNGNERSFFARVTVPNEDGCIRPGMQGRGKISTGWEPAGWVLFRRSVIWLWSKLWSWVGW
jgi:RND family efflux transporter MFP subunit